MAHSNQARKRIRQTARRTDTNRSRLSRIRTYIKKVETAIAGGDKGAAEQAFREAMPEIHRGVTRGLLHRNTAARKLSRLQRRISGLSA